MARITVSDAGMRGSSSVATVASTTSSTGDGTINLTSAPYSCDKTGAADSTAGLQAACDFVDAAGGGYDLIAPPGVYKLNSTVTITTLYGLGIRGTGSLFSPVFSFTGTSNANGAGALDLNATGVYFDGLNFTYTNTGFTGDLVKFRSVSGINSQCRVQRCHFQSNTSGFPARSMLSLDAWLGSSIEECVFKSSQNGIVLEGNWCNTMHISKCVFSNQVLRSIWIACFGSGLESVSIEKSIFEGLGSGAIGSIDATKQDGTNAQIYTTFAISYCWFGDDFSLGIPWLKATTVQGPGMLLNNAFYSNGNRATQPQLWLSSNWLLVGNYMEASICPNLNQYGASLTSLGNRYSMPDAQRWVVNPNSTIGTFPTELPQVRSFGDFPQNSAGGALLPQQGGMGYAVAPSGAFGHSTYGKFVGGLDQLNPVAGTWNAGDFANNQNGRQYICVVGGAPGTWVCPADRRAPASETDPQAAGTVTPDMYNGTTFFYRLTGNITVAAPTHATAGDRITFVFAQDGTGGRTVDLTAYTPANFAPNTAANKRNSVTFEKTTSYGWVQISAVIAT